MNSEIKVLQPKDLPNELLRSGKSLSGIGCAELAWLYRDAIKAIEWCSAHNYAILGGDVLQEKQEQFVYTYDSWYLDRNNLDWIKYVEESRKKALLYINSYYQRNGNDYYYALTVAMEL